MISNYFSYNESLCFKSRPSDHLSRPMVFGVCLSHSTQMGGTVGHNCIFHVLSWSVFINHAIRVLSHRQYRLINSKKYRVIQNDFRCTIVQRQFCTKFGKQPPSDNSIRRWCAQFQETGCVCIPELKVRIRTAIEIITADMRNELDHRVDVCRISKDAHIEHL